MIEYMRICPNCGGEAARVILLGLPHWFCLDEECCACWGFWSRITAPFSFLWDGLLLTYSPGPLNYVRALWKWLTLEGLEDPE